VKFKFVILTLNGVNIRCIWVEICPEHKNLSKKFFGRNGSFVKSIPGCDPLADGHLHADLIADVDAGQLELEPI
jgi:hypothetical protein